MQKKDFKKLELLGGGKKNTKIYKVQYVHTGQIFALKEVEAKNLDKLNEYKEEAAQLIKAQHHPNILQCYGYYFYETSYNSYKIGMITELFNREDNLEIIYRSREKQHLFWSEEALLKIAYNLIDTFAYLEHIGICHRDIKPTNLFLLDNYQIKVIDFGESIVNYEDEDEEDNQVATVRGTPQYLSPKLWEAHVIKKAKEVEHNMFKSDVFSAGLVLFQLTAMKDVGGFNQKTEHNDGEELIQKGLKELSKKYSNKLLDIIAKMLIFEEEKRPNFEQMGKFIAGEDYIPRVDKNIMEQKDDYHEKRIREGKLREKIKEFENKVEKKEKNEKTTKFRNYVNENNIYINLKDVYYWFEYGGKSIAEFKIKEKDKNNPTNKWEYLPKKNIFNFPYHYILVYVDEKYGYYLLGGCDPDNCYQFRNGIISKKTNMSILRSFMAVISNDLFIFAIGGFDSKEKCQVSSIEIYDVEKDQWKTGLLQDLNIPRSQSTALLFNGSNIYVFGGFNLNYGTLNSIELIDIENKQTSLLNLKMLIPLRRFNCLKISEEKVLLLGGLTINTKNNNQCFCVNLKDNTIEEAKTINKGGVLEQEIIFEEDGTMHLFYEKSFGTEPHEHVEVNFFDLFNV